MDKKEVIKGVYAECNPYIPSVIYNTISANVCIMSKERLYKSMHMLSYEIIYKKYKEYRTRAYRLLNTNNYLKRHHQPMKRRGV